MIVCHLSLVAGRGKLRDHEESHNKSRSYFCDRCPKTFKAKKNLDQHFRYIHRKEDSSGVGVTLSNEKKARNQLSIELSKSSISVQSQSLGGVSHEKELGSPPAPSSICSGTAADLTNNWSMTPQNIGGTGVPEQQQCLNNLMLPHNTTTFLFQLD